MGWGYVRGPLWLGDPTLALASVTFVNIWRGTPFYAISFLAGLLTISPDLYEAAAIDGHRGCAALNGRAQPPQTFQSARAIRTFGEIPDDGSTFCDGSKHRQPMADRFVTRYVDHSGDFRCRRDFSGQKLLHGLSVAWSLTLKNPRVT